VDVRRRSYARRLVPAPRLAKLLLAASLASLAPALAFGGSYAFTQLNIRDERTGKGTVATPDFFTFAKNWVTPYSTNGFVSSAFLQGDANRYYRANQTGLYLSDKFAVLPNLTITAGIRYDWNEGP